MATIYCLCGKTNPARRAFAERVNRYVKRTESPEYPDSLVDAVVVLDDVARCIKTGARQVTPAGMQAFPNVDIYRCQNCGSEFTVEA